MSRSEEWGGDAGAFAASAPWADCAVPAGGAGSAGGGDATAVGVCPALCEGGTGTGNVGSTEP